MTDQAVQLSSEQPLPEAIVNVLQSFQDVFEEPQGMPPIRNQDHQILLKPGVEPVHIEPYRYPQIQKNEIEKQIQLMLEAEIIRPSRSPFTSPVILIKKKDNT
ncbi:hypothetical protein ACHQM5_020808 [Ranunculus cassubicifolius]